MKIDFNKPTEEKPHSVGDGIQKIWRFENGFGASVVQFNIVGVTGIFGGSYTDNETEWELAVIKFKGESIGEFKLKYDTGITEDVIGHLTEDKVLEVLEKIRKLKEVTSSNE